MPLTGSDMTVQGPSDRAAFEQPKTPRLSLDMFCETDLSMHAVHAQTLSHLEISM